MSIFVLKKVVHGFLILGALFMLLSCSSYSEKKAPCDYNGTFCGRKIAINH